MHGTWPAMVLLAAGSCVPGGTASPRATAAPVHTAVVEGPTDASFSPPSPSPQPPPVALEHAPGVRCPVSFRDSDVVLARVGDVIITACDLVLARERDLREGRSIRDARALLAELVDDALMAQAAAERHLDGSPDVARRIDETLAAVLVRSAALDATFGDRPSDATIQHYYDTHPDEFATPEQVHLREIVVATEHEAREIIAAAASTPFDALVSRTIVDAGRRDLGDLGWVSAGGNDRVAAPVASAGFGLSEPLSVAPEPVRADVTILVGRHHRPRTEMRWHVVQLLARRPAGTVSLADAAPLIRHRLAYARFDAERRAAHDRLLENARHATPPELHAAALRHVHVHLEPAAPARHRTNPH